MPPRGGLGYRLLFAGTIVTSLNDVNKRPHFPAFSSCGGLILLNHQLLLFRLTIEASWGKPRNRFQMILPTLVTESAYD
jgi:hypothetical protein